eukprot:Phypoly_transcript_21750.p1 GENE.Phypoly_transcript_21750~~Phypoly_transcript_21750.p1  ORF type:complete len:194 (+),score=27.34 Phypoly_transcript_21750:47-628(+)
MEYENEEYNWQPFIDVDAPFPNQVSPFATTLESTVQTLFSMIDISPNDVLLDIGSGDGRIVLYAAETKQIKAIGIDINPDLVAQSKKAANSKGVSEKTAFMVKNFLDEGFDWTFKASELGWGNTEDITYPTILTMYLLPEALELLYPKLEEYCNLMHKNGKKARILSIFFKLEKWSEWFVSASEKNNVFLYIK